MNLMVKCEGLSDPHCFWTFSSFLQKKTGGFFVASCLPFRYHILPIMTRKTNYVKSSDFQKNALNFEN